jgi:arabinogalactan oligomer/maltooligosaccharide transport system permease protein
MTTGEGREPRRSLPSSPFLKGTVVRFLVVGVIDALLVFAIPALVAASSWTLLGILGVVALLVNWSYLSPRARALRWLTPGLVFLLAFLVWPLVYTAYVSLTNYQTGNILSKQQVIEQLERETIATSEGGVDLELGVYRDTTGQIAFLVTDPEGKSYFGLARARTDVPVAEPLQDPTALGATDADGDGILEQIGDFEFVPPLERFQLASQLENLVLDVPGRGVAQVQTTSAARLITGGARYVYDPETDTLLDTQNNITCVVNEGNFVCDGRALDPGWRTTIGFRNYLDVFTDRQLRGPFLKVFIWNFAFAGLSVLLSFTLGLILANAIQDDRLKGKSIYRSLLIIPYAIPAFISIIIWRGLLNDQIGQVNDLLGSVGIGSVPWLLDPFWAKASLLLVNTWLGFPYMFLICSGALQAVPGELKEAARVDGAGAARVFRTITLPLLLVSTAPLLIGSFGFNFNNFALPFLLTNGGPPVPGATIPVGETDLLITFTFDLAVNSGRGNRFALGSAIVVVIFLILVMISAVSFRFTRRLEDVYGNL